MTVSKPAYTYAAQVIRWVDGDTVDLRVDLGFRTWVETRFRLYGIDTPERGEAKWAEASALARELCPDGSAVVVSTHKAADKYGRWLAEVGVPGKTATFRTVNDELVRAGLAVPYDGGTK